MATGTVQTVVACLPTDFSQSDLAPTASDCPSGTQLGTIQAYLLDPSEQPNYEAISGPFDYGVASSIWVMSFSFVVGLYLVSKSAGEVLRMIRR